MAESKPIHNKNLSVHTTHVNYIWTFPTHSALIVNLYFGIYTTYQRCHLPILPSMTWYTNFNLNASLMVTVLWVRGGIHFFNWKIHILTANHMGLPSLKLTFSPMKMDGWNTIVSFWDGLFSGAMLVSGRVIFHQKWELPSLKLTTKAPENRWLGDDPSHK